eukprot:COSAG04_NODE_18424_length_442_cov_0.603499_1_plen_43_part_01
MVAATHLPKALSTPTVGSSKQLDMVRRLGERRAATVLRMTALL